MKIRITRPSPELPTNNNFNKYQKLGFWATVTEVNSQTYTCTVLTSNKEVIRNIPLSTREWISDDSAERNLPPKGTFVFILMPDNCISNAFVLCSGYPKGEPALEQLFAASDSEQKEKDQEREVITPGGWNETENYKTGTRTMTSPDGKIEIKATLKDKTAESLTVTCFDTAITIDKNGVTLNPKKIELDAGSGDVSVKTKGKVTVDAQSVNINDGALEITKS